MTKLERRLADLESQYAEKKAQGKRFTIHLSLDEFAPDGDPVKREEQLVRFQNAVQAAKAYKEATGEEPIFYFFNFMPKCKWGDDDITRRMFTALKYADEAATAIMEDAGFKHTESFGRGIGAYEKYLEGVSA